MQNETTRKLSPNQNVHRISFILISSLSLSLCLLLFTLGMCSGISEVVISIRIRHVSITTTKATADQ